MVRVEAVIVADARRRTGADGGVGIGGALPAAEAGVDPVPFAQIHFSGAEAAADEPRALGEKHQQHRSSDPLRLADRSKHENGPQDEDRVFYHGGA